MSLHLLDLRPIKDFTPAGKANLAVSIAPLFDGTPMVVSLYSDLIWDFYPYVPQKNISLSNKLVDWRICLPDGRLLSDPVHAKLLESTKDFLWSLFSNPVEGRKRPAMLTLLRKVNDIKHLLRWMVRSGINHFADLAGHTLDYAQAAKFDETGRAVAIELVGKRLQLLEDLYSQHTKLHDALRMHPWPHETATSIAGINQSWSHRKPRTDFIPDAVATRLTEVALDYVQNRSGAILGALEAAGAAEREKQSSGYGESARIAARIAAARAAGYKGSADLSAEAYQLRTACYIVINLFSGIRDSEMRSLAENCISRGKSKDGSTDILWLYGTIYKTGKRPKRWIVPPVVEKAVNVLVLLTFPLRTRLRQECDELETRIPLSAGRLRASQMKRFDSVSKQKNCLFLGETRFKSKEINSLSIGIINKSLKRFCADFNIVDDDGKPYPLHTHQFRRTYARFVARSELGDLLTLRDHFGHWSLDMTVYYAEGGADDYESDTELLDMVTKEKTERQVDIMGNYLESDAPLANGSHWLKDWRASVRTAVNKEELINEYAGTITLNGTGHSWCVGNARGTGCGGLCVFEAQMCVECNYGIIGQEHRPVWQGIREQQLEALALDDMGASGQARAQNILNYAEKVLRRLDGQELA